MGEYDKVGRLRRACTHDCASHGLVMPAHSCLITGGNGKVVDTRTGPSSSAGVTCRQRAMDTRKDST